jgi:ribosomal protein L12E/L44/L45/RPP1/RPP2
MTTNDKTGDQLANTIRKAKSGTSATPEAASTPAPAKKAPAKKSSPAKKKATRPATKKTQESQQAAGSFLHSRRVWPD